jgi:hypothetical protein
MVINGSYVSYNTSNGEYKKIKITTIYKVLLAPIQITLLFVKNEV